MPVGYRQETDTLGAEEIPDTALWGVHTKRALENFAIGDRTVGDYPHFVRALAAVKAAAASANARLGVLPEEKASMIVDACAHVRGGRFHDQFIVGITQGGAGTSTNMNANEVIANIALETRGWEPGDYARLHPVDDVNRGQSTNDVYPTALKLALHAATEDLLVEHRQLRAAFRAKADEMAHVLKVGRTQLQDAVPMTLGQEFGAFASILEADGQRLADALPALLEISLGATAVGTGINSHPEYAAVVREELGAIIGAACRTAPDLVAATVDTGPMLTLSAALKRAATQLSKICNDLRLLSSGPQAGFAEITLPARQVGSSIMPAKVNPVIPELVNQVAFLVAGADVTVTLAAESGQLQLNAFEPVIASSLLEAISKFAAACRILREKCVEGISAREDHLRAMSSSSAGVATALAPRLGYTAAAALAAAALRTGASVHRLVVDEGLFTPAQAKKLLSPERLSGLEPVTAPISLVDPTSTRS